MKVYVNREPVIGPWGGGNKTLISIVDALRNKGHEVVFRLCEDIDVLFCIDPRPNKYGEWYQHILYYKNRAGAKIVQRVGDVGTHGKPDLTDLPNQSIQHSDVVIFLSEWAKDYVDHKSTNYKILENSPLLEFYSNRKDSSDLPEKSIIVTHHWSTNPKKGFSFYKHLDDYIGKNDTKYDFTYIGRLPDGFKFEHAEHIEPGGDNILISKLLPDSHIYLTASEEEAGANHVLEALACALPVVYHSKGGSIVNYCKGYGVQYNSYHSMIESFDRVARDYESYKTKALKFNRKMEDTIKEYVRIIENV